MQPFILTPEPIHLRLLKALAIIVLIFVGTLDTTIGRTRDDDDTNRISSPTSGSTQTSGSSASALPTPAPEVVVTDAYRYAHEAREGDHDYKERRNSAGIGDIMVVKVRNLRDLVDQAKCLGGYKMPNCREQEIALYLDGRQIKNIVPESGAPEPQEGKLQFHLQRSLDSDEAWADLLGAPPLGPQFFTRPTDVSVGLQTGYPVPTLVRSANQFYLTRIRRWRFVICLAVLLFVLCLLLWLITGSDILRDSGAAPQGTDGRGRTKRKPFSLARCQMAFWFVCVTSSFLFIWQVTGGYDIITGSVLGLIGIGAGTALGAAVIDAGKNAGSGNELDTLKTEEATLQNELSALSTQTDSNPPPPNLGQLQLTRATIRARLSLIQQQIIRLSAATAPQESGGFLRDLLTDATGISFHRFQMFVWTLVLGALFIFSVWDRLSMPEFSATLLALLGVSSGTYLGFKIPERHHP